MLLSFAPSEKANHQSKPPDPPPDEENEVQYRGGLASSVICLLPSPKNSKRRQMQGEAGVEGPSASSLLGERHLHGFLGSRPPLFCPSPCATSDLLGPPSHHALVDSPPWQRHLQRTSAYVGTPSCMSGSLGFWAGATAAEVWPWSAPGAGFSASAHCSEPSSRTTPR